MQYCSEMLKRLAIIIAIVISSNFDAEFGHIHTNNSLVSAIKCYVGYGQRGLQALLYIITNNITYFSNYKFAVFEGFILGKDLSTH